MNGTGKFAVLALVVAFLMVAGTANAQSYACCSAQIPGQVNDQYWFVVSPPDITYECLSPTMLRDYADLNGLSNADFQYVLSITGYAWEINGCISNFNPCLNGDVWCDNNDGQDGIIGIQDDFDDDDDDGFGANQVIYDRNLMETIDFLNPCGNAGSFRRTFNSISTCPNGSTRRTVSHLVTIVDTVLPSLYPPADMTLECGSPVADDDLGIARVEDLCNPTLARDSINNQPIGRITAPVPGCANNVFSTITRTWTAADGCNTITRSQTVSLVDTLPPIISGVVDETIECGVDTPVSVATATDSCDTVPTVSGPTSTLFEGRCFGEYSTERVWTASDDCGNSATATSILYTQDTRPPVFNLPAPIEETRLSCYTNVPAPTAYTATDLCQGAIPVVVKEDLDISDFELERTFTSYNPGFSPGSGRDLFKRTLNRTYTATDDCGNSAVYRQNFFIEQISNVIVTITTPQPIVAVRGGTVTIQFDVANSVCTTYGLRVTYNPFPLSFDSGSGACTGAGKDITGDSFCTLGNVLPSTVSLSVTLNVPRYLEENTLSIAFLPEAISRISLNNPTVAVLDIQ
eukprot:TRINITY_DN31_c0_g1_i2.p1 TRINITY_DN31_c0_g1~~TRINITY_DN31_c0_g1_i2.p1  ORF type:complete len:645 (+),score=189.85 TRINITY_DN31_c0_g1_i2:210-1937(+)